MIEEIKRMLFLKPFYLFFVTIVTFIFDSCVIITLRKPAHSNGIGLIRMDYIGDFILWLDAAKEFRNLYPNTKITLIANHTWSDLARLLPYWDEVISVDRKRLTRNLLYRFKTLRQIRQLGFELAIQPTFSREYLRGDSLIRASRALHRIGSTGNLSNINSWQKNISDKWYSQLIPATAKPLMELQRNAEFMRGIGLRDFVANIPALPKFPDLPDNLTIEQPYFVVFPGSSRPGKQWPTAQFGKLLAEVAAQRGWHAVLCGSREEYVLCAQIITVARVEATNLAGKTSLSELFELIRRAKILVSNDTSAVHIAAAVGTPSVCILGGGHYGRFMPYVVNCANQPIPVPVVHRMNCFGCNWQCTQPHDKDVAMPCISAITIDHVMEAIERIFASRA
jgi:ADP-heptose:LPS heptosyltransferase